MGLKFGMRFETRVCEVCGGTRLAGQPCPECKRPAAAHEVDPEVRRRRRIADELTGVLSAPVEHGTPSSIGDFTDLADVTISALLRAIKHVASSNDGLEDARRACRDVARVAAWSEWEAPRPYRAVWGELSGVGPELLKSAQLWIDVLGSSTMLNAQRRADEAQECLDNIVESTARAEDELAELNLLLGNDSEETLRMASAIALRRYVRASHGDVSLTEVDRFGCERLARVVGDSAQIDVGVGVALLWMSVVGEVFLDQRRLYALARGTYESLVRSRGLEAMVSHNDWQSGQLQAMVAVRRIMSVLGSMTASADDAESAARSALLAAQDLVHGPMRHLLATVLGTHKRQTYAAFVLRDGADMLKQYGQLIDSAAVGSAEDLRNASAHSDYAVDQDGVVLNPHRAPRRLTWSELDDGVLETLETVMALSIGVVCAVTVKGLVDQGSGSLEDAGLSIPDALAALLVMGGWTDVQVTLSERSCNVEAVGDASLALSLVAAIGVGLPDTVEVINIDLADDGRRRRFVVQTQHMRERRLAAVADSELAMAEYLMSVHLDGETYMTRTAFRRLLTARIEGALSLEYTAFVREARRYRASAQLVGDGYLAGIVESVLEIRRCQEMGAAPSEKAKRDLGELMQILRTRVAQTYSL